MIDPAFIDEIIQKGSEAKEKASQNFRSMSFDQLNWKSSPANWSIAQCLDHLIVSHNAYFRDLEKIVSGKYQISFWEKFSPFTNICGRIMKDQLQETVKRKMKAPAEIRPSASEINMDIVKRYFNNLDKFLEYISNCRDIDIDKIVINSPLIAIVTYTLRDAFQFLLQHEHRHINQAIRVKTNEKFPN
jgi:hypothetical protein